MAVLNAERNDQATFAAPTSTCPGRIGQPAEWLRYLTERCVIIPAADVLPKRAALFLADAIGFVDAMLPTETGRIARQEATASRGLRGWRARVLGGRRLAGPYRDLVVLRRFRRGREHPRDWKAIEVNGDIVHRLLEQNRSFIVATAHFHHAAEIVVPDVLITRSAGWSPGSAIPARRLAPRVLRERLQNHLLYNLEPKLVGRPASPVLPYVGEGDVMAAMVAHLKQPGAVVRIFIDAHWEKPSAHRRSFAGIGDRGFALGVTRLARTTQCPVLTCVCTYDSHDTVRVEWGPCVEPPAPEDTSLDVANLDRLLDVLERAVGNHPEQYLHPMGFDRCWRADEQRWVDG